MNPTNNPYRPPNEPRVSQSTLPINWKSFCLFNLGILAVLVALAFISFAWAQYQEEIVSQQLGRRFASYDEEFHTVIHPVNGFIVIAVVFAVANLVFLAVRFLNRLGQK